MKNIIPENKIIIVKKFIYLRWTEITKNRQKKAARDKHEMHIRRADQINSEGHLIKGNVVSMRFFWWGQRPFYLKIWSKDLTTLFQTIGSFHMIVSSQGLKTIFSLFSFCHTTSWPNPSSTMHGLDEWDGKALEVTRLEVGVDALVDRRRMASVAYLRT